MTHLQRLGITALKVHPDAVKIATEGALWGSVAAHGLLNDGMIASDDAGGHGVSPFLNCGGRPRDPRGPRGVPVSELRGAPPRPPGPRGVPVSELRGAPPRPPASSTSAVTRSAGCMPNG